MFLCFGHQTFEHVFTLWALNKLCSHILSYEDCIDPVLFVGEQPWCFWMFPSNKCLSTNSLDFISCSLTNMLVSTYCLLTFHTFFSQRTCGMFKLVLNLTFRFNKLQEKKKKKKKRSKLDLHEPFISNFLWSFWTPKCDKPS
jgi:hypothetical protein